MKAEINNAAKRGTKYIIYIVFYIIFCFVTLFISTYLLDYYVQKDNISQMNGTIGLIAEKVNVSFGMMTDYVEQQANILSVHENVDFNEEYNELQNLVDNMEYISLGLIDKEGNFYCKDGEKQDLLKYGFDDIVIGNELLYITEPYLSCVTGSNVLTMFSPVFQNGSYAGSLFVTYSLETVQNLAKTNVLEQDVESYLMNSISGNYITCSNTDKSPAGVWMNMSLIKNEMICSDGYDCNTWMHNMIVNSEDNVLCYSLDEMDYTQAYVRIDNMDDWYVVVRMPNTGLSDSMKDILMCIATCAAVLILGTLCGAFLLYFNEYRQKKKIEIISQFDPLTNLMNRRAFNKKMTKIFRNKDKIKQSIYMFIDIDFFKEINDNYGHAIGDEILQKVAGIMKDVFEKYGYVARIGGDEFNVYLSDMEKDEDTEILIHQYVSRIEKIVLDDGRKLPIHCSIGVAKLAADSDDLESVTQRADEALYYVKRNGKNNFCWYENIDSTEKSE